MSNKDNYPAGHQFALKWAQDIIAAAEAEAELERQRKEAKALEEEEEFIAYCNVRLEQTFHTPFAIEERRFSLNGQLFEFQKDGYGHPKLYALWKCPKCQEIVCVSELLTPDQLARVIIRPLSASNSPHYCRSAAPLQNAVSDATDEEPDPFEE